MRQKMLFTLILLMSMSFTLSLAQITVTGTVTSAETGEPIEGVSVEVQGEEESTLTDSEGAYTIMVSSQASMLEFSAQGMKTELIQVGTQRTIDIELEARSEEEYPEQEHGMELITIEGTVKCAETGEPLEGVSVSEQDGLHETVTDRRGAYEIEVKSDNSVLEFYYDGKEIKKVLVGDQRTINVELKNIEKNIY